MTFLPALPKITERRFLQQLIGVHTRNGTERTGGLLRMFGWLLWHDEATNAPRTCPRCHAPINLPRNPPGLPDILAVRGDTLWFLELKAGRNKLSEAQEAWYTALKGVSKIRVGIRRPEDIKTIVGDMR